MVKLLFSCFDDQEELERRDGPTREYESPSVLVGYPAYLDALLSGRAKAILAAFAQDKIPPELSPLRWPVRLIQPDERRENTLRKARLCEAASRFAQYLETRDAPSLFLQQYLDLGTATRDMIDYPSTLPAEFDVLVTQVYEHYRQLQQLSPRFFVQADVSGSLRFVPELPQKVEDKPSRTKTPRKKRLGKRFNVQTYISQHHRVDGDSKDINFEALRVNATARILNVSPREVSSVLADYFGGFAKYEQRCMARDTHWLTEKLQLLERDINKAVRADVEHKIEISPD